MGIEGKWWILYEDEPLSVDRTRVYDLKEGHVLDGRSGEAVGTYEAVNEGVDLTFAADSHGEIEVIQFRAAARLVECDGRFESVTPDFDPDADGFQVVFTNARFLEYCASRPANDHETEEEEADRLDWESDEFSLTSYGSCFRDGPLVYELSEQNEREFRAMERRAGIAVVE